MKYYALNDRSYSRFECVNKKLGSHVGISTIDNIG